MTHNENKDCNIVFFIFTFHEIRNIHNYNRRYQRHVVNMSLICSIIIMNISYFMKSENKNYNITILILIMCHTKSVKYV